MATDMIKIGGGSVSVPTMPSLPPELAWLVSEGEFAPRYLTPQDRIERLANKGELESLFQAARAVRNSLEPVEQRWLLDRLSLLWDHMSNERDPNRATAWLHETHRLLCDLPADILARAIDAAIIASDRGFMPSVGAIRSFADPQVAKRERISWRLVEMVRTYASLRDGLQGPSGSIIAPCPDALAEQLLAEFGSLRAPSSRQPITDPEFPIA